MNLKEHIRNIPNFPKQGIQFKDLSTILIDPAVFSQVIDELTERAQKYDFDKIGALESRGFWFAPTVAYNLKKPLFPIRKPGKLPGKTVQQAYKLEYGEGIIEIHDDAVNPEEKVLLIDDLLATGGTLKGSCSLVEKVGGRVAGCLLVVELEFLKGRELLEGYKVETLIKYR
ncbi:adenine phosphoribosyltransferase [archaeon]|nr:adenine phosphoribosyltransferase [archaeon]